MGMKREMLVVFDMDGVLTEYPSSWEFVHRNIGVDNSNNASLFKTGSITYEEFMERDVSMWIGKLGTVPRSRIEEILSEIPVRADIVESISRLKMKGHKVAIVSGGISWLADGINRKVKFHYVFANSIMTDEKRNLIPSGVMNVNYRRKDICIKYLQELLNIGKENTVSIGDSLDDASMFSVSGYSIAYNPSVIRLSKSASATVRSPNLMPAIELVEEYGHMLEQKTNSSRQ